MERNHKEVKQLDTGKQVAYINDAERSEYLSILRHVNIYTLHYQLDEGCQKDVVKRAFAQAELRRRERNTTWLVAAVSFTAGGIINALISYCLTPVS